MKNKKEIIDNNHYMANAQKNCEDVSNMKVSKKLLLLWTTNL